VKNLSASGGADTNPVMNTDVNRSRMPRWRTLVVLCVGLIIVVGGVMVLAVLKRSEQSLELSHAGEELGSQRLGGSEYVTGAPFSRKRPLSGPDAGQATGETRSAFIGPNGRTLTPDRVLVFSQERAMQHVKYLASTIGPRPAGTSAERRAAQYVEEVFRKQGYQCYVQEFPIWDDLVSANVIAENSQSDDVIVAGAHIDSVAGAPGANDNASGVAVLLELARHFAGVHGHRALRFVAFGAEEGQYRQGRSVPGTGRSGSWHYVKSLDSDELPMIELMMNFDMVGAGTQLDIGDLSPHGQTPALTCLSIADRLGVEAVFDQFGGKSDYRPFHDLGVPIIAFAWGTHPSHHTPQDTIDIIDPAKMEGAFRVAVRYIEAMVFD